METIQAELIGAICFANRFQPGILLPDAEWDGVLDEDPFPLGASHLVKLSVQAEMKIEPWKLPEGHYITPEQLQNLTRRIKAYVEKKFHESMKPFPRCTSNDSEGGCDEILTKIRSWIVWNSEENPRAITIPRFMAQDKVFHLAKLRALGAALYGYFGYELPAEH
jgi:hypothetical protein